MAVTLELTVNGTVRPIGRYLSWSPDPASLRVADSDGEPSPIRVRLRSGAGPGGRLEFRAERKDAPAAELSLDLPTDGTGRDFFLSGKFGSPSTADGDTPLEVLDRDAANVALASFPLMVRVRKDAEQLTDAERDRFLMALAKLNDQGRGPYQTYRDSHMAMTLDEAHGFDGFLPWHRAYLLDFERELQRINPSVALPYWRWDRGAPKLFSGDFLGAPQPSGLAGFAPSNPLQVWSVDGQAGIVRTPVFSIATPAHNPAGFPPAPDSTVTLATASYTTLRLPFELNPHGRAHTCFNGPIRNPPTAPRDPLFFLLHNNVDRLWATWQWLQKRFDPADLDAYGFPGRAGDPRSTRIGHNLLDTMWPWNGVTVSPRPSTAPRMPFPLTLLTTPGNRPTVRSMIDYQGLHDPSAGLGFDYDSVPYQPELP